MSVKTISKEDQTMSREVLIQMLNSQLQAVDKLPKPSQLVLHLKFGRTEKKDLSQYFLFKD